MLTFPKPDPLHGDNLESELVAAGFLEAQVSTMFEDGVEILTVSCLDESNVAGIQAVIDAHTGPTPEQTRPRDVAVEVDEAIVAIRTELANWPVDLVAGQSVNQVGQRVNLVSAQVRRNTLRLLRLAQILRGSYDE